MWGLKIIFLYLIFGLFFNHLYGQKENSYADVIVEAHFEPNNLGFKFFYGGFPNQFPMDLPLTVVLEEDNRFISLPKGSFLVLKFTDNFIIDGDGPDIFLKEIGASGERASVYISSDGVHFTFLGIARDDSTTALDLASIQYKQPVHYVKIVGLDNFGGSPGFDLDCVYALPRSNVNSYAFLSDFEKEKGEIQFPIKILVDNYNYTEYELTPDVLNSLLKVVQWIKEHPNVHVKVMAHCDDFGSKEFQLSETQSRAKWVYDFLIMKGISKNQIEYQGMGSSFPLKTTDNLKKSVNRRIELEITQK